MKKKSVITVLILAILISMFTGCAEKNSGPLWIVVDLDQSVNSPLREALDDLKWWVEKTTGLEEENVVFEIIPDDGAARDTAIDRIRTEIMSGGGPDVFIVQCDSWYKPLLFQMPEKAMELDIFLPLDEYIEQAEYAEWDKFTQSVMDAGRDDEGQQLVPLTYFLPAAMYRASDVSHTPIKMTWDEMRSTEELQDAVIRLGSGFTPNRTWDFPIEFLLGDLADYREEQLLFTEEELLEHVAAICELSEYYDENQLYEKQFCTKTALGPRFNWTGTAKEGFDNTGMNCNGAVLNGITELDALTLVPLYSDDGGNTAVVTSFAAVNRNTRRPEEAFKVLDLLMMTDRQANGSLFHDHVYSKYEYTCMPMHEDIMNSEHEMRGTYAANLWFRLDEHNFSAVCAVRDQITSVHFSGSLNKELELMMVACYRDYRNGEDYTQTVHEAYEAMKQMIAE